MANSKSSRKKPPSNHQATDYDLPWKQIIEKLLESFLDFFFPQIYADIDFTRGYEVKSNELYKLLKDQHIGKKYTDELIKVYLKDGSETWLLIHIEVQNYKEKNFAKRMYVYNYRIFDKYNREVVSLVILTDPDAIMQLEKEQKMTYVTHMERIAEKKGKLEGKLEVAENMLKKEFSVKDIVEMTSLSEEEIMTLKEKLKEE